MSLIAYHLPLDCHPEFGNNKTLLDQTGLPGGSPIDGEEGFCGQLRLTVSCRSINWQIGSHPA